MAQRINSDAVKKAKTLISENKINAEGDWSFDSDDSDRLLASVNNDWNEYAKWFLVEDTDSSEETKARYKYPYGKNGQIWRNAVIAIKTYAAREDYESLAETADELLDAIDEKLGNKMKKYAEVKLQKQEDSEDYEIAATTNDVDRDNDVVEPNGVTNLQEYLKNNPVILFGHDYRSPPIGKAVSGEVSNDKLKLKIRFADTEFGREIKYLYDNGFMNSFSIGFIPKNHKVINDQWHWTEWELLEVSAVPVPANAAANMLRTVKQYGVELPEVESLFRKASRGAEAAKSGEVSTKARQDYREAYIQFLKKRS